MLNDDLLASVLYIDLSTYESWTRSRPEIFEKGFGGTGAAILLYEEECIEGADPLGPENVIILAVGALTGLYPLASKTVALFKSPHISNLGESHCGGRSAVAIRMAGYGAIVIKGASKRPVYLAIHGSSVHFRDAATLWGTSSAFTVGKILREREPGSGLRTIMRIGRAGENLVTYSCVTTETYRHFGRLGLGAVFGAKKLKAVVISGKRSIPVRDFNEYRSLYDEIYTSATSADLMRKYHDLGTAGNVLPLNVVGALPTKNLQSGRFEGAENISGESFASGYLGRRLACSHCPVGCIHIAALRQPYQKEPYFYKTSMICYDYEPIFAIASMLGGDSVPGMLGLMDSIEKLGLDVMSTGVVLAWATEAYCRNVFTVSDSLNVAFAWGDYDGYRRAVEYIAGRANAFYNTLARGVEYASATYGGREYALAFGGNEMPGYHTGPAAYAGYLTGSRHSHLDSAGYSIDQKTTKGDRPSPSVVADKIVAEESWRQILSSLVVCFFARGLYTPEVVSKALSLSGIDASANQLQHVGREIYYRKFSLKMQEGFSLASLRIPSRIFETESPLGRIKEEYLRSIITSVEEQITELKES